MLLFDNIWWVIWLEEFLWSRHFDPSINPLWLAISSFTSTEVREMIWDSRGAWGNRSCSLLSFRLISRHGAHLLSNFSTSLNLHFWYKNLCYLCRIFIFSYYLRFLSWLKFWEKSFTMMWEASVIKKRNFLILFFMHKLWLGFPWLMVKPDLCNFLYSIWSAIFLHFLAYLLFVDIEMNHRVGL